MQYYELPFAAFQSQHRCGWGSDVLLPAIKRVGLLEPGRDPGRFRLLLAVDIPQLGFHGFCRSKGFEEVGLNFSTSP